MLKSLIVKEVKDLLRDRKILFAMIIMPLIIYIGMGAAMSSLMEQSIKQVEETVKAGVKIALLNEDNGPWSKAFIEYAEKYWNATIIPINTTNLNKALNTTESLGLKALYIIPPGFSANISSEKPGVIKVYFILHDLSITSMGLLSVYNNIVSGFSKYLSSIIITRTAKVNPAFAMAPITGETQVLLSGTIVSANLVQALSGQLFVLPVAPMLVIGYAASIAAMSIGVEKEEKTLEVLLSLPIRRRDIVLSKLTGSLLISLLASISMLIGFSYYMRSMTSIGVNSTSEATQISMTGGIFGLIGVPGLILYVLSVFFAVFLASTLGLYLGSFGENVRSAQSMVGYIWIIVFFPLYMAIFTDFALDPLAKILAISVIPFAAPLVVLKAFLSGKIIYGVISIASSIGLLALIVYLLTKRFEGEKLLVGKSKRKKKPAFFKFRL